ncbi:putative oxidoreductase, short-chain dehydrogenase family [Cryptosporidium felis]|nr:putative oxidoreductase, short-chain dehydrogenase family [Cryptosporidium felis]
MIISTLNGLLVYVLLISILYEPAFLSIFIFVVGLASPLIIYYVGFFGRLAFSFAFLATIGVIYFSVLLLICRLVAVGRCLPKKELRNGNLLTGKTVVITGATGGIGLETTKQLVKWGISELVLCCRNQVMMESLKRQLSHVGTTPIRIHCIECDLTSLRSVELCSREILLKVDKVDILINNAGIMAPPFRLINGIEFQFLTNHLGHFYLTKNLMPLLQKSKSRIINVSSIAHLSVPLGFSIDELEKVDENSYSRSKFYGISKLCNIYFTRELQKRYGSSGIVAVALHPGCVDTGLGRYISKGSILFSLTYPVMKFFSKTPFTGAQTTLYCCSAPIEKLIPGGYYSQCELDISSPISLDMNISETIWNYSESLCKKINETTL